MTLHSGARVVEALTTKEDARMDTPKAISDDSRTASAAGGVVTSGQHTPGPWEINYVVNGAFQIADQAEQCVIASRNEYPGRHAEFVANARLIAAAPDLLTALKALFADYKRLADSGDAGNWALENQDVGKQALAAIAKATHV